MAETDINAGSSTTPDFAAQIAQRETQGVANPDTTGNAHSTALGRHQFLAGTWMAFAKANPGLFQGMDDQQILDKRTDPNYSKLGTEWYGRYNAGILQQHGIAPTAGNLGLAHAFGGAGAAGLLGQSDDTTLHDALVATQGQDAATRILAANPAYNGMTVGQIKARYNGMGGAVPAAPAPPPAATPATPAVASTTPVSPGLNPQLAQMQRLALINSLVTPPQAQARPAMGDTSGAYGWGNALLAQVQPAAQSNPLQTMLNIQRMRLLADNSTGGYNPLLGSGTGLLG